ncbi:MAG: hypothetical protein ACYTFA_02535 [Planctomycetota bacterium]|jgi:hypothetical protein
MQERFQLPMPMWRVQYELLGGHRRMLAIGAICMTVLVAGSFGFRQTLLHESLTVVAGWMLDGLAVIQIAVVVLGGCNAVYRAMLRDYDTKMIESHRLTPMSNMTAALGYLFGSTFQILAVFLVILTFGSVLTSLAGYRVVDWIYGNVFLLNGAVTLWSMVALSGLRLAKPINPVPVIVGAAVLGYVWLVVVPAAGLLLCAYPAVIGFQIITGASTLTPQAVGILGGVNLVMTAFWLSAAAAKYRRPDLPALNTLRGLLLLAMWVVLGTAGIVLYASGRFAGIPIPRGDGLILIQWLATMILSLVVALPAIAGAVECRMLIRRGSSMRGWSDRVPAVVTAAIAAALICGVMGAAGKYVWRGIDSEYEPGMQWVYSVSACFLATFTARAVFLVGYSLGKKRRALATIFLLVLWAAPPLIDLIRAIAAVEFDRPFALTSLLGFSPAGTIAGAWADVRISLWPGLLTQGVVTIALTAIAWRVTPDGWHERAAEIT